MTAPHERVSIRADATESSYHGMVLVHSVLMSDLASASTAHDRQHQRLARDALSCVFAYVHAPCHFSSLKSIEYFCRNGAVLPALAG